MTTKNPAIKQQNLQVRNIMVFILVMALSGLADLLAEIVPTFEIGPIEVGISTFWFVPLTLVILFFGWWAALAVPIGEIVFSDLVLGEFGGLGEMQEVVLVTLALYFACRIVTDPRNQKLIVIAGLLSYLFAELPAAFIDMLVVWFGVESFEAVEGLPQSVFAVEMIDFVVEYLITGILFGLLPALWLVPKLHGKIEPLMGIKPRSPQDPLPAMSTTKVVVLAVGGFLLALLITILASMGVNLVEWEPEFLESIGNWFIWIAIILAAVIAAVVLIVRKPASN
jgi:hypothetical protein